MLSKIEKLITELETAVIETKEQVEEYRIKWLSKKGEITLLFDEFKQVAPELKREVGQKLNQLKVNAQNKINELKEKFEQSNLNATSNIDLTLPGEPYINLGSRHPISITL